MVSVVRLRSPFIAERRLAVLAASALATVLGGCSTNIARLENPPSAGLSDAPPQPSAPVYGNRSGAGGPVDRNGWPNSGPRGALPAPAAQANAARIERGPDAPGGGLGPSVPFDAAKPAADARIAAAPARPAAGTGATIEVQSGDTLYSLSRKHKVSIAALMEVNALKSANLKPGQKLVLPSGSRPLSKPVRVAGLPEAPLPAASASQPAAAASAPSPAAPAAPTTWEGTYTLKPGDSLYAVSRTFKVPVAELQRVNGITDAAKVRPGAVLKVPGNAGAATTMAAAPPANMSDGPRIPPLPPAQVTPPTRLLNGQATPEATPAAAKADAATERRQASAALSAPAAAQPRFAWPVRGKMLAEFGKRPDGTHNDGVNIAVPAGTDITAAETGTVAYAGSELKGFGNLILLRHDNGWVTAYAHADQILVKRGDAVKRGQVIAKAGKTGSVDQPQLHFELRQGSKPIDPMPYMEK